MSLELPDVLFEEDGNKNYRSQIPLLGWSYANLTILHRLSAEPVPIRRLLR